MKDQEMFEALIREKACEKGYTMMNEAYSFREFPNLDRVRTMLSILKEARRVNIEEHRIYPNMLIDCTTTPERMQFAFNRIKEERENRHDTTEITPNDILKKFIILFGMPENAESFTKYCRNDRKKLQSDSLSTKDTLMIFT